MLNHIGTQIIETERLVLRRFQIEDAEQMFNNWASDPDNIKYLSWAAHKDRFEIESIIKTWVEDYSSLKTYRWCITDKQTGEVIGGIDVVRMFEDIECCEIGYVLSKRFWNRGIMTEVLHAVLEYLFSKVNFHRIQLRHDVENIASGKVMLKNGLQREGLLREVEKSPQGKWRNMVIYSILRDEFKARNL